MRKLRITADQLRVAADWCDNYEGDDETAIGVRAVGDWLRSQVAQRVKAEFVRKVVKGSACTRERATAYFDKWLAEKGL